MEIRKALVTDAEAIARIARTARESEMPYLPDLHTPAEDLAFFESEIGSSDCQVALLDGQVVGFGCVREGWLNHLYIAPDSQGQGAGSALLAHFCDSVEQFWVFARNTKARKFYLSRGFVEVEETDGSGNEEKEPDVRFARKESGS